MKKLFVVLFIFVFSCQYKANQENKIPFDKMKVVLYQLVQADEYYSRTSILDSSLLKDKKNIQFYKQIFELNKVDKDDFYATLSYYQKRPTEFKELMDSAYELSKREKLQLKIYWQILENLLAQRLLLREVLITKLVYLKQFLNVMKIPEF